MNPNPKIFFPISVGARALALYRGAVAIMVELACNEPELWIALVADGKDETGEVAGYLHLVKRITLEPGLSTYAVVAVRPPHDPPPNPATFRTLFQAPSLADYGALLQLKNAPGR